MGAPDFANATGRPWAINPKADNEVVDSFGYLVFEIPSGDFPGDLESARDDAALAKARTHASTEGE